MVHHPGRVDPHVVRHHVARESDAAPPGPLFQVPEGGIAAKIVGDRVRGERVGRGDRVGVPAHLLDELAGAASLPEPDEPEPAHAAAGEKVQLLVRDMVEPRDLLAVAP